MVIISMHTVKTTKNLEQLIEAYMNQADMGFKIEEFNDRGTTMAEIRGKIEAMEYHSTGTMPDSDHQLKLSKNFVLVVERIPCHVFLELKILFIIAE